MAPEQIRAEIRLLRHLFDRLPAMIAYWDQDARNVTANAAYLEWFGFRPEELVGRHISELLGPEVYAKNLPFIEGALAGQEQLFDRTLIDQSGRTRHTQASYVPDVVGDEVHGFFVLVTDVTPRVEAQRAMDEAQALAHLGSWELTPGTGEIHWSRELFAIVGLDPDRDRPVLSTLALHIHPEDRNRVLSNIDHATRTASAYTIDYRIIRTDGTEREVVSSGKPVLGPEGEVTRLTGTLQDVTEANAVSRELAHINGELRRANQLNADVIAMLGHDIKSPIAVIQGCLEILEDGGSLDEAQRNLLVARSSTATRRLRAMVDNILALATIDSGEIKPRQERIGPATAVVEIVDALGLTGVPVETPSVELPAVDFDVVHLEQIVTNLLTNAFRYGVEPVRAVVRSGADGVQIAVTDAGVGVPEAAIDSLFTRFARTGAQQALVGGTGFGLYMAAKLAEANGATLGYRAPDGTDSHAFVLTIPVERVSLG